MAQLKDLLADLISADEQRAQSAVEKLAALDATVLDSLLELASSSDADQRWWAVTALGQSPHTRAGQLLPFLSDAAPDVRQAAALGLCAHPDPDAVAQLVRALADPDPLAASLASNALVRIGGAAVPVLLEIMGADERPAAYVRILALRALAEIKDHRAIPLLLKSLEDDSALLRHWAQSGLEALGLDMVYIKP
ncbi:MAG TPA: HEAT repeat domain-containing protein [Anaerolineales bacterium]